MRKLTPAETAKLFGEIADLEALAKERGSGLPPDLEALAARIFGEEKAPDFGESLERLTVALVALRAALAPNALTASRLGRVTGGSLCREIFLQALERIASAAGSLPIVPRGEISKEAPELLLNPNFWLSLEGLREKALAGDKRASDLLNRVLDVLRVPKRRSDAGRAKAAAELIKAARELLRDPEFMAAPLSRLAVEIARDGRRGPVPLRAVELVLHEAPALLRVLRTEAGGKRLEAVRLRAVLAARALAAEGRRVRAAKRKRARTQGPK